MENLSRKLNLAGRPGGRIMPFWSSMRALEINHIMYADDVLIFSNVGKTYLNLMKLMNNICSSSGQSLQAVKCKIYFSKHINTSRRNALFGLSGFRQGVFVVWYLGAPLFDGHPRISCFQDIVKKIQSHLAGWMKSFLSMAGRITMIWSVLQSIPIHCLAVLQVPKSVLLSIVRLMRNFLWDRGKESRCHWVSWGKVCKPIDNRGFGIRSMSSVMLALHGKLAWNYLKGESLLEKYAESRFSIGRKGSYLWKNISPFITSIAMDCHWKIGNRMTRVSTFCQNIGLPCPRHIKEKLIKDVLHQMDLRRLLLHNSNPIILKSISYNYLSNVPDMVGWGSDPSGLVTSGNFMRHLRPHLHHIK